LAVIDFFALLFMGRLISEGLIPLASIVGAIAIFISLVYSRRAFSPFRWMAIGIAFILMFTVYPICYTILLSFTNMSGGHLITKEQAIARLESRTYVPEGATEYAWTAYQSGEDYLLVLEDDAGNYTLVGTDREPQRISLDQFGETDSDGYPTSIERYQRISRRDVVARLTQIGALEFNGEEGSILVQSLRVAAQARQIYQYDEATDTMVDSRDGTIYRPVEGTFTSDAGDELAHGFTIGIGIENYRRFVSEERYAKPLGRIIIWNFAFAFFSVAVSFFVGLLIALAFDRLPGRRLIRTLLLVPYPIPVLVAITIWKALLNQQSRMYTAFLNLFAEAPSFFTDRNWTRVALIILNVYLSYPYFYILSAGALRAIPQELFQAAAIDGADGLATVRHITMPMILRILAPLLIASFSFNFNNFILIWTFNAGLPPQPETIVPTGYTDLLISLIFRLGFGTANVANYGFASAITVLLFLFVGEMVFFQTRSTKAFKEDTL
jgi:arabinogalactan oligomer/maltooligosaccharide transport system permease protein